MKNKFAISLCLAIQLSTLGAHGSSINRNLDFNYCVPIEKIDVNPYRKFKDGKELAYLMLFRSYISLDSSEAGILDGFEFSPDGKIFTGRLSIDLKWDDGTLVLPSEAGESLVKTLPFRTIGERIKVDFERGGPSGVKTIDGRTFQIFFNTNIENATGVLREALSTNSRHNRFWLYKKNKNGSEQILAKHQFISKDGFLGIKVGDYRVALLNKNQCSTTDFTIFYDAIEKNISDYSYEKSSSPSAITVLTNSERLNLQQRTAMISFIRFAFKDQPTELGFSNSDSFFNQGEPGFSEKKFWNKNKSLTKKKKYKIAYGNPIFINILETAAKSQGIDIILIPTPTKDTDIDAGVQASGMQKGRHVILQDFLDWPMVRTFLKKTPKTLGSLVEIAKRSASTIPPDNIILQKFEKNSSSEQSFAPVARKYPMAYSKKSLPICLNWTTTGELIFLTKTLCGK